MRRKKNVSAHIPVGRWAAGYHQTTAGRRRNVNTACRLQVQMTDGHAAISARVPLSVHACRCPCTRAAVRACVPLSVHACRCPCMHAAVRACMPLSVHACRCPSVVWLSCWEGVRTVSAPQCGGLPTAKDCGNANYCSKDHQATHEPPEKVVGAL